MFIKALALGRPPGMSDICIDSEQRIPKPDISDTSLDSICTSLIFTALKLLEN
jgi:hypothetical protein